MSDLRTCLVVLNPREIHECLESFHAVEQDIGWLTGYEEPELEGAMAALISSTDYDFYLVTADDTVITQEAVDAVIELLEAGHPVVTGYCPLDSQSHLVNLSKKPLMSPIPSVVSYEFYQRIEVQTYPTPYVPTFFAGMALTGMHRTGWQAFPMSPSPLGKQTDYSLSYRLQEAGIPIVGARDAMIGHVKEVWNCPDQEPRKRLLIGEIEPKVRVEVKVGSEVG